MILPMQGIVKYAKNNIIVLLIERSSSSPKHKRRTQENTPSLIAANRS